MRTIQIDDVIKKLEHVLKKQLTREEVSEWAYERMAALEWMEEKEGKSLTKQELAVFRCLTIVYGMDLQNTPNEYFHVDNDFRDWIKAFQEEERNFKIKD